MTKECWTVSIQGANGPMGKLEVIGPPQPHETAGVYVRLESHDGAYLGSIDGHDLVRLALRLQRYVLAGRAPSTRREGRR